MVIEWTQVLKGRGQRNGYKFFIDQVMATAYTLFFNELPPRMFPKCKYFLQLGPKIKYGDWYILEDHTGLEDLWI
jgi:hypothetical protein